MAKEFNGDGKEARSLADMPRSVMKKPSVEFLLLLLHVLVLPSFSKFLERIIFNRLYVYLTNLHILCDNQFGFRKKHSTTLALIDLDAKISSVIDRGEL